MIDRLYNTIFRFDWSEFFFNWIRTLMIEDVIWLYCPLKQICDIVLRKWNLLSSNQHYETGRVECTVQLVPSNEPQVLDMSMLILENTWLSRDKHFVHFPIAKTSPYLLLVNCNLNLNPDKLYSFKSLRCPVSYTMFFHYHHMQFIVGQVQTHHDGTKNTSQLHQPKSTVINKYTFSCNLSNISEKEYTAISGKNVLFLNRQ